MMASPGLIPATLAADPSLHSVGWSRMSAWNSLVAQVFDYLKLRGPDVSCYYCWR